MQTNSINKVIIVGYLGGEPEGRYTPNGRATVSFSVATNESWKKEGEQKQHTEWHNVVAWDSLADFVQEYLHKGQLVYVEGRLRTRPWTSKEGASMKTTEIIANQITSLGSKGIKKET